MNFIFEFLFLLIVIVSAQFLSNFLLTISKRLMILDDASISPERKNQIVPVPLLGGMSIIINSLFFCTLIYILVNFNTLFGGNNWFFDFFQEGFSSLNIDLKGLFVSYQDWISFLQKEFGENYSISKINFLGILGGILIISVAGILDDLGLFDNGIKLKKHTQTNIDINLDRKEDEQEDFRLKLPKICYFFGLIIGLIVLIYTSNIKIEVLSYPFDNIRFGPFFSSFLAFLWLGLCMMTTKFIDGSDGLCASICLVCFLTIASISSLPSISQPFTFIMVMIWAFSTLPFLYNNFPEAKQYLGESGSTILGIMIGVFSIISGAKVATTSMVLGWFVWDIILVILTRSLTKRSFFRGMTEGDSTSHWHHRLKHFGLNKFQVLIFTVFLICFFASISLMGSYYYPSFIGSGIKLLPLALQFLILLIVFGLRAKKIEK